MNESASRISQLDELRGEEMRTPDEVAAMLRLVALGFGERRIAAELGCSRIRHERQSAWFDGIEAAFSHFSGVPRGALDPLY